MFRSMLLSGWTIVRSSLAALLLALPSAPLLAADHELPHVVMLVSEPEYQTEVSLPAFAESHLKGKYRTSILFADPADENSIQGIDAVASADVLLVSVRRRTLPTSQLELIRAYVAAGKPVIGIRTANHAFSVRNTEVEQGRGVWPEWDREVFGGSYTNHYGNALQTTIALNEQRAAKSPLLKGLRKMQPFVSGGSLYKVAPLAPQARVLMQGTVEGEPAQPVAWTFRRTDGGKSFYTSLGHVDDFAGDVLPKLLVNALQWSLK